MKLIKYLLLVSMLTLTLAPLVSNAEWVVYDDFNDGLFSYSKWSVSDRMGFRGVGISEINGVLELLANTTTSENRNHILLQAKRVPKNTRGFRVKYRVSKNCAHAHIFDNPSQNDIDKFDFQISTGRTFESLSRFEPDENVYAPLSMGLLMDSTDESQGVYKYDCVSGLYAGVWVDSGPTRSYLSSAGDYEPGHKPDNFNSYNETNRAKYTGENISMTMLYQNAKKVRAWSNLNFYQQTTITNPKLILSSDAPQSIPGLRGPFDPELWIRLSLLRDPLAVNTCSVSINEVQLFLD